MISKNNVTKALSVLVLAGQCNIALSDNESLAKESIAVKDGKTSSEKNVESLFSKSGNNYSLIKKGEFQGGLSVEYSNFEQVQQTSVILDNNFTMLDLSLDSERVINTTFDIDYGLTSNVTASISIPSSIKSNELEGLTVAGVGDLQLSLRWQPLPSNAGGLTAITFMSVSIDTGTSPYEITAGEDLATGNGHKGLSVGMSVFKSFDPLMGFASFSYTHNADIKDINQERVFFSEAGMVQGELTEIETGDSFSATFGLTYAITYDFSLSGQYQHSITNKSKFIWTSVDADNTTYSSSTDSAIFDNNLVKFTASWKGDDSSYTNLYLLLPLTDGQPAAVVGVALSVF